MIFTIRKWRKNRDKTGVVLNASAYDDDNGRWRNVKIYVPFQTDEDHPDATTACVKTGKVSGKEVCLISVKIFDNYLSDEKDKGKKNGTKKGDDGKAGASDDDWTDYDGPLG